MKRLLKSQEAIDIVTAWLDEEFRMECERLVTKSGNYDERCSALITQDERKRLLDEIRGKFRSLHEQAKSDNNIQANSL